jgi:hypothetical protein
MKPTTATSATKEILAFLNEGEQVTWATRQQLVDMISDFLAPRKKMAIFSAVLIVVFTVFDLVTFFHGPIILANPALDVVPGRVLNVLTQSSEYGSFPGCFFGFVPPLLSLTTALVGLYWLGALVKHEVKLFAAWKKEKAVL